MHGILTVYNVLGYFLLIYVNDARTDDNIPRGSETKWAKERKKERN